MRTLRERAVKRRRAGRRRACRRRAWRRVSAAAASGRPGQSGPASVQQRDVRPFDRGNRESCEAAYIRAGVGEGNPQGGQRLPRPRADVMQSDAGAVSIALLGTRQQVHEERHGGGRRRSYISNVLLAQRANARIRVQQCRGECWKRGADVDSGAARRAGQSFTQDAERESGVLSEIHVGIGKCARQSGNAVRAQRLQPGVDLSSSCFGRRG